MRLTHTRWHEMAILFVLAGLLFGLASTAAAQSQAGTGQIVGTVFDATGAAVPGAKVSVVRKETGLTREVQSGDSGDYRVVLLPPGHYIVTVEKSGFKSFKATVEVTVGAALTVDANLALGAITEVIEVLAASPIETTTPQSDALLNLRSISNLPINGRRFHDFVTLAPTVQIEPARNQISFVGQRGINSNVTIDGADYNEPFFGGMRGGERANNAFNIPQEAISQFQVVSYGYSAEFGRSTGGVLNAVTKSGTNDWHGSGFYSLRHKNLAKKDALNRRALDTLHGFGGSIGGPIKHDKSFLFFAIENQKNDNPRFVIFRRLDPAGTRTAADAEAFDFYRGLQTPFTQTNDAITFLGRWDQQFNPNHRVAVRYHYSKNTAKNAVATGDAISPETSAALENNGTEGDKTNTVTGTWTGIFSPHVINEFRGNFSREDRPRSANALKAGVSNLIGDTGTRSFLPTTAFDYRVQVSNNLTWNRGRHSVKAGGDFNYLFVDQFFKFNQFGAISISGSNVIALLNIMSVGSGGTGDPVNRLDDAAVTYRLNIGNGKLRASMQSLGFFGQDAWRITPRLTLTAGFRWEGYFNPQPATSNTALTDTVRNFTFPFGKRDPGFIPDNFRQYMPRVGIAWDPGGNAKTVIRASAGLYYAQTPLLLLAGPLNNFRTPPGDLSKQLPFDVSSLPSTDPNRNCKTVYCQMLKIGVDLNTSTLDKLPTLTPQQFLDIGAKLGLSFDPNKGSAPITWADNYENPRSWQWSVGVEHEIRRGWAVGGDFVYVNTVHLERNHDWNMPAPLICAGTPLPAGCVSANLSLRPCFGLRGGTPCSTRSRPIGSLDSVQIRESSARAFYRGFTLRSVYRGSRYQLQAYYTLGKNLSDDDNERSAGGQDAENAYNFKPEYSFSSLDVRHLFIFNSVVDLPWGFTVGALGRFSSSRPFTPSTGADSNGDFFSRDKAFQAPGVPFKRNSFRDRAFYVTNLRVAKRIALPREGMRLDLAVDVFNLFNFDNVTYGSSNQIYGLGIDAKGASVAIDPRFQRLRNPSACLSPTNTTGNLNCYDTSNTPGRPLQVQVGIRFHF